MKGVLMARFRWVGVGILALTLASCVVQRNPVTGNKRAYAYTWQQEIQIGKESDPAVIAQFGLYDDPDLAEYVVRVGEAVLAESHLRRPDTPEEFRNTAFTFRVLDSPVVNAFALPGGYIYVTRGLLAHIENEAQLAMVLGHEVGHVAGRHASKRALQQQLGTFGLVAGAIAGEALGLPGGEILNSGGTVAQLLFLRYGRDDERESDELGVEYAAKATYEAGEGAAFFTTLKRLSDAAGASVPSFLSTHPDPGEREQTIRELAASWRARVTMDRLGRDTHLNQIDGMVVGDDPRQGYVDAGVFFHPSLRFQFPVPAEWQVVNQASQVAMVPPDQKGLLVFTIESDATSAAEAGRAFAAQEGLTVVTQGTASTGYVPAYVVVVDVTDQSGQVIRALARFAEYDGRVYRFLGYALQADFNRYQDDFSGVAQGFNRLADPARINVQPTRVDITPAGRTGSFASFVPQRLPEGFSAETLAILNQLSTETTVPAGTRLKLVH